jgi:hypothetical protein
VNTPKAQNATNSKNTVDKCEQPKNYFTGTNIKKSPYVSKATHFRHYPEVLFFLEEMNKTAERIG